MQAAIEVINAVVGFIVKVAGILGIKSTFTAIAIVAVVSIMFIVLCIHRLPKVLNSLTLIGNNSLRKKEQILSSEFIEKEAKYLINDNLQTGYVKKIAGLRANSLFMLKKYTQLLIASQGEISQTQLKKAQPYLIIINSKLKVNLTQFDTITKFLGGFLWWLLIIVGLLSFFAFFISLNFVDLAQPMNNKEFANLLFWPLMSMALFMMGFVFLKMYLEVIAAEKIDDFITRNPDWDKD